MNLYDDLYDNLYDITQVLLSDPCVDAAYFSLLITFVGVTYYNNPTEINLAIIDAILKEIFRN